MTHEKDTLEEFACSLERISDIIKDITRLEEKKADAAAQKRHDTMNDFLKQEQASLLKLRGQEQKRQRLAEAMDWGGLTFRQILEQSSAVQRQRLQPLFEQLDSQVKLLLETKDSAERIIKVRIREFETLLYRDKGIVYDGSGSIEKKFPPSFHDKYV
ncbi:MAG: flagellar protein FlgN [Clostridiales bacterium]|nr:flagellar protein FlgN [Clostridiales bacterium]